MVERKQNSGFRIRNYRRRCLEASESFGEIKKGISAPYNTYFNVASLTKPVTAMVALRLVSLGKLKLDEPLDQYWTDPILQMIRDARCLPQELFFLIRQDSRIGDGAIRIKTKF